MTERTDEEKWDAAQEGAELLREELIDEAIEELERVVLEQPDNEYGYYFLGGAHFEKGNFEKALKAYYTALEKKPMYLGAMVGTGHTLRMLGRGEQALRMAKQALARQKDDPDVHYLLGLLHFQRGEKAAAKEWLERFIESRPEIEVALEVEGMLQVIRGEVLQSPTDPDGAD